MSVFTDAQDEYAKQFPQLAAYGWGPSTKAERWVNLLNVGRTSGKGERERREAGGSF